MRIDESKLNISSSWTKIYECENYRRYDRIKYLTNVQTDLGTLGIMVSIRRTEMIIHAFVDGFYLKYTKQSKDYKEIRKYIRYVIRHWHKFYVRRILEYQNEEIIPFEYYRTMDKIMFCTSLKMRNRKRLIQHYLLSEHKDTKYVVFDCINMLVNRDEDITDIVEPFLTHTATWIKNLPFDNLWEDKFNLPAMPVGIDTDSYKTKRMSYDSFKDMIKGWTSDEVMELIGRYIMMTPNDYRKDPKNLLYQILTRRKGKWKNTN